MTDNPSSGTVCENCHLPESKHEEWLGWSCCPGTHNPFRPMAEPAEPIPSLPQTSPSDTPKVEEVARLFQRMVMNGTGSYFDLEPIREILRPLFPSGSTALQPSPGTGEANGCGMHGELCRSSDQHHFLKYHDPKSEFFLGSRCVNCCYGQIDSERITAKWEANGWVRTATELPDDDSEVFAAIPWEHNASGERKYLIHDCAYYEGGPGSEQKIFTDCEGEEFEAKDVDYWIYKHKLAEQLPAPSSVPPAEPKETGE